MAAEEPPPVAETAPGWSEREAVDEPPPPEKKKKLGGEGVEWFVGAQYLWAAGKAMPGVTFRLGKDIAALDVDATLLWLTESSPDADVSFLGTEFGGALMLVPLRTPRFQLSGGVGGDFYALWNLNADTWEMALAGKLAFHFLLTPQICLFGSARAYPLSSGGLELGTTRDGSNGLPVLFATGVAGRFE